MNAKTRFEEKAKRLGIKNVFVTGRFATTRQKVSEKQYERAEALLAQARNIKIDSIEFRRTVLSDGQVKGAVDTLVWLRSGRTDCAWVWMGRSGGGWALLDLDYGN